MSKATKIEEVARAIEAVEYFLNGSTVPTRIGAGLSPLLARAAIESMRVPTPAMVAAAHDRLGGNGTVEDVYTAMIDAALKETA